MLDLSDSKLAEALKNSPDWRSGMSTILDLFAQDMRPYSSGEIASALRQNRPDFVFAVETVGKELRDLFYGQGLPGYPDQGVTGPTGTTNPPMQIGRFTVGKYRTPAGKEVFVYGPDLSACNGHEFEVFVPRPGETMANAPAPAVNTPAAATGPGSSVHTAAVAVFGAQPAAKDIRASVWPDGRIGLPRAAFETFCYMNGNPIRVGDPVFVVVEPDVKATITVIDPGTGAAKSHNLWKDQGRIAFSSPDSTKPFPAGKGYKVTVTASAIEVDLANPL